MANCKLSLCFLAFASVLATCYATGQSNYISSSKKQQEVAVESVNHMTASMLTDALQILREALRSSDGNVCSILRQRFSAKYPEYTWHVVLYRGFSVQYIKSVDLKVGNDHYLLFATKS